MRVNLLIKLLIYLVVILIIFFIIKEFTFTKNSEEPYDKLKDTDLLVELKSLLGNNVSIKYILQWTKPNTIPFIYMGTGRNTFLQRNCSFTNCFVTSNRELLGDYKKFDIIAFHGPEIIKYNKKQLPSERLAFQKYAFVSIESSDYYPVCNSMFDDFFNWTWTYKLDSDEPFGYISIRDKNQIVIGPKIDMNWLKLEDMDPLPKELKTQLGNKHKAAAWLVSNCKARSKRQEFVEKLQKELLKYNLTVDIYGGCGKLKCSVEDMRTCLKNMEDKYYFYLSFENSFSNDYVTEKLLHALQNNMVPIVYGGADYKRFLPDGAYLNARELGPVKLANTMWDIINDTSRYLDFFRWKSHYTFHDRSESPETDDYCRFCAMANYEGSKTTLSWYSDFKGWWTPPGRC